MIIYRNNAEPHQTGVYCIRNTVNNKRYIGSAAASFKKRFSRHVSDLKRGIHHSQPLQRAWNKHGKDSFEFTVLVVVDAADVIEHEQAWIDFYRTCDRTRGYNIAPIAGASNGVVHSAASRKRQSDAKKKEWEDPAYREKQIQAINRGWVDPAVRARKSASMKEVLAAPSARENMSAAQKISKGTPEVRLQMSEASKARWADDATREVMVAARRARASDPEYRAMVAASVKRMWADPEYKASRLLKAKLLRASKRLIIIQVDQT